MFDRKIAAKSASSIFFEELNDIDIYIEDTATGYRKIFKELLNKALGSHFKIEQIFPIGKRDDVINECERNQSYTGRKRVYIVDGDFYILNNNDRRDLRGLFVIPRYCIENYFFNEQAIIQTAYEEAVEVDIETIESKLNFNLWLAENERLLLDLFIVYAVCYRYIPMEQTVGYKVTKLCSSNSGIVCPDKIRTRIADLRHKLITYLGEGMLELEINTIKERIQNQDKKLLRYVSGKDYLLPLMIARLQSFLKFSASNSTLKVRLAMRSEVEELKFIEDFIIE